MEKCYLEALVCYFTKSNTPPWAFFTFFNLYKWFQIMQCVSFTNGTFHPFEVDKIGTRNSEVLAG